MKVKLTTSLVGAGWAAQVGDEITRPKEQAMRLIEAGCAVPAKGGRVETADADKPVENRKRSTQ